MYDSTNGSGFGAIKGVTTAGEAHRTAVHLDDARELALGAAVRRAEATMQPEEVARLRHMNTVAREEETIVHHDDNSDDYSAKS